MYYIYVQNLEHITLSRDVYVFFRLQDYPLQFQIHCTSYSSSKMYDHSNVLFYVNILEKYRIYKDIKRIHIYILIYLIIKIKLYHCDLHVHADKY